MSQQDDDKPVVTRGGWRTHLKALFWSVFFVVVGVLMLTLPPPTGPGFPWTEPRQHIVGVLCILFGGVGLAILLYLAVRAMAQKSKDGRR